MKDLQGGTWCVYVCRHIWNNSLHQGVAQDLGHRDGARGSKLALGHPMLEVDQFWGFFFVCFEPPLAVLYGYSWSMLRNCSCWVWEPYGVPEIESGFILCRLCARQMANRCAVALNPSHLKTHMDFKLVKICVF